MICGDYGDCSNMGAQAEGWKSTYWPAGLYDSQPPVCVGLVEVPPADLGGVGLGSGSSGSAVAVVCEGVTE